MKYQRWYDEIMRRAADRTLNGYSERHHIVPRSRGGSNAKSNIVRLTYREHFLAHWLLTKFTSGHDLVLMRHALAMMCKAGRGKRIVASWQYEISRRVFHGFKHSEEECNRRRQRMRGVKMLDSTRAKLRGPRGAIPRISEANRKRVQPKRTESWRQHLADAIREHWKARSKEVSLKTREKRSASLNGHKISTETRAKISASVKKSWLDRQSISEKVM